jgi:hypothetical protein
MGNGLPEIAPGQRTPLVLALLDIIQQQHEAIQQLRDELARLKGQNPKPQIQPSRLEQAPSRLPAAGCRRSEAARFAEAFQERRTDHSSRSIGACAESARWFGVAGF